LANAELGAKQLCPNCASKFYDLGRRPAVCPKCGETFDPEEALRNRRVRARSSAVPDYEDDAAEKPKPDADVEGFEDEADETPEIDADAVLAPAEPDEDAVEDPGAPVAPAGDLGVDFAEDDEVADEEEADDLPFIDDEEDDFDEEIEGLPGEKNDE
jgi:uncharacterized protein (TIGR02300 family)